MFMQLHASNCLHWLLLHLLLQLLLLTVQIYQSMASYAMASRPSCRNANKLHATAILPFCLPTQSWCSAPIIGADCAKAGLLCLIKGAEGQWRSTPQRSMICYTIILFT